MARSSNPWGAGLVTRSAALIGLVLVLLWTGCAGPHVRVPPRAPDASEPSLEIQRRLLRDAQELHRQGRSQAAARLLERWLRTYPKSPLASEAHWWLGRSYEQAGDLDAALAEYRLVVQTEGGSERGTAARNRLAALERPAALPRPAGRQIVLGVTAARLPQPPLLEGWLRTMAKAGVTALAVEAGPEESRSADGAAAARGVYFRTDWAFTVRDVIGPLASEAHRQGLVVYVTVNPWRMAWVDPSLGWQAQAYDITSGQIKPSPFLDLFHPALQEYLIGLLTDLAGSGADGVLFRATPGVEPGERLSRFAQEGVERDFGVRLDPASLVGGPRGYASEVWRWLGWESRQTVKVLDRLAQAMRKRTPSVQVGLEVHEEALLDPVAALIRYREDVLEARQRAWDFYVIVPGTALPSVQGKGTAQVVAKVKPLLGDRHPIWMGARLHAGDLTTLAERLPAAIEQAAFPPGIGLWSILSAGPVP